MIQLEGKRDRDARPGQDPAHIAMAEGGLMHATDYDAASVLQ